MTKLFFACLNKLDNNLRCEDKNCIFNTQGENPRCEYFDDEEDTCDFVPVLEEKDLVKQDFLVLKGVSN